MIFYIDKIVDSTITFVDATFYILPTRDTSDLSQNIYHETSTEEFNTHVLRSSLLPSDGTYYIYCVRTDDRGFKHTVGPTELQYNQGRNAEVYVPMSRIEQPTIDVNVDGDNITISTSTIRPAVAHTHTMYVIYNQYKEVIYFDVSEDDLTTLTLDKSNNTDIANSTSLDIRVSQGSNGFYSPVAQYKVNANGVKPVIAKRLSDVTPDAPFVSVVNGEYDIVSYIVYNNSNDSIIYKGHPDAGLGLDKILIPSGILLPNMEYRLKINFKSNGTYEPQDTIVIYEYILTTINSHSILAYDPNRTYANIYEHLTTYDIIINFPRSDVVGRDGIIHYSDNGTLLSASDLALLECDKPNILISMSSNYVLLQKSNLTDYVVYAVNGTNPFNKLYEFTVEGDIYPIADTHKALRIHEDILYYYDMRTGDSVVRNNDLVGNNSTKYSIVPITQTSYMIHADSSNSYIYYDTSNVINLVDIDVNLSGYEAVHCPDGIRYIDRATGKVSSLINNVFTSDIATLPSDTEIVSLSKDTDGTILVQTENDTYRYV